MAQVTELIADGKAEPNGPLTRVSHDDRRDQH